MIINNLGLNELKKEERLCKQCGLEEVEDEEHFLLRCEGWMQEREMMIECVEMQVGEFCTATDDKKVALILDQACCDRIGKGSREDVAEQIPAEVLMCLDVFVAPVL